jgi:hypothetical protein
LRSIIRLLPLALLASTGPTSSAAGPAETRLILITPNGMPVSTGEAAEAVREEGGTPRHCFADGSCIAAIDPDCAEDLRRRLPRGWQVSAASAPESSGPAGTVWNRLLTRRDKTWAEPSGEGSPLVGDALLPPEPTDMRKGAGAPGPFGAGFWDGSEYLLGRVGVSVVFVESDGTEEPSTEEWTEEEEALVLAGIGEAMNWWAARAPGGLLTLHYEVHARVPVAREPIRMRQRDESVWIRSSLAALGFGSSNVFQGTQDLVNSFKARAELDWGFVIYVVDSSEDEDGMFADGFFAYAYLGGPYMVLTLDNDGWGAENLASVCAHEVGHIFYALDQYYSAHVPCDRAAGYLAQATENSEYGSCGENEASCIMRSRPIDRASLSRTARGQVGWTDSDADGVPDLLDLPPQIEIVRASGGETIHVEGRALVTALPNRNPLGYGHAISIDTIRTIEMQIDDGPWTGAALEGGPRSPWEKSFRADAAPAESGEHRVRLRAAGVAGTSAAPVCSLLVRAGEKVFPRSTAGGDPLSPPLLGIRPNPFNPATDITVRFDLPSRISATVHDARGAIVRTLFEGTVPAGESSIRWDGLDDRGREAPSGRYFCRVTSAAGSSALAMTLLR